MKTAWMLGVVGCLAAAVRIAAAQDDLPGPLFSGLGTLQHPVSTRSPRAQRYFDQGMRLLFGFNHREAIRSFRSAAAVDPECAMAYWGVAYALGPHVNKPMDAGDATAAWQALSEAVAHRARASAAEQEYISALETRYRREFTPDRSDLDRAFAAAMRSLVGRHPDDLDARTLFAEALMNTMPWDYWTHDRTPKPETGEILAALQFVISRDPNHPGANHFYIHAVEAGPNPESGLPSADRLRGCAPAAGHLVHMPSHIYMRVGQYHDASESNRLAAKADSEYIRHCRAQGFYPGVYYPHNLHFLWWAEVFEGRGRDALRTARQAAEYSLDNACGPNQALEAPRLRHLPWLTLVRFGRGDEMLAVPRPPETNDFLVDRALWHFTRGWVLATRHALEGAGNEQRQLAEIAGSDAARDLGSPLFPVPGLLAVADRWLAARVAEARGDSAGMITAFEAAVAAEDSIPYMEPAYWPFPVRPAFGAALLRAGRSAQAEAVFREDLRRWPRNGWSLFGLEQALSAQALAEDAAQVHRQFVEAWRHADAPPDLAWY
ncbi:MAG: hypothetical protein JNL10_18385 [Verrucomicrobiales bacterium]|nr:hypothetical protein [Verrucomicrobiales bacterium]